MLRPNYPIETERLLLRPLRADDLDAFHAIHAFADVVRYLYFDSPSREVARGMLEKRVRHFEILGEGDKLLLALELRGGGGMIGDVSLTWLSEEHQQGEIGFALHPDQQGKGLAREAAEAMLRLGFENLGLHRILGRLDARNAASAKVLERLGMRREAHILENEFVKGEWTDELLYAVLAREWAARGTMKSGVTAPTAPSPRLPESP
jgi:RimJ/RimL family protein N-acetyltransferase